MRHCLKNQTTKQTEKRVGGYESGSARCHKGTGDAGIQKDGEGQASVLPCQTRSWPFIMPIAVAARRPSRAEGWREGHGFSCGCYGAPGRICPSLLMEQRVEEGGRQSSENNRSPPFPSFISGADVGCMCLEWGYWIRGREKGSMSGLRGF